LETFPRLFCFPKSRINENGGNVKRFDYRDNEAKSKPPRETANYITTD